jgi:hypothetical protein
MRSVHPFSAIKCCVTGCQQTFSSAGVWYWHVRKTHLLEYLKGKRKRSCETSDSNEDTTIDTVISAIPSGSMEEDESVMHTEESATNQLQTTEIAKDEVASWLLRLKEKHHLSQKAVKDVIEFSQVVHSSAITQACERASAFSLCDNNGILDSLSSIPHPLTDLSSEYLLRMHLKKGFPFVGPIWHEVGSHVDVDKAGSPVNKSDGFYYVSLLSTIEMLLNNEHIFTEVTTGPHCSGTNELYDICDGRLFCNHSLFKEHPNALQVILYYDEFSAVNPVSPASTKLKMGAVYFILANIDPALRSKLEAINLLMLFPYTLLKTYTFDQILEPVVEELKVLSSAEGYAFKVKRKVVHLKGALLAVIGDTPALAKVGGFKEGVGFATRKCRHCMAYNPKIGKEFTEDKFVMRTLEMHRQHCEYIERNGISENERSHFSKIYGINRRSCLVDLPYFDVTKQLPEDIMHVLFEGLFPLSMELYLAHVIDSLKVLTLSEINDRLVGYKYAYFEVKPNKLKSLALSSGGASGQTGIILRINTIDIIIYRECVILMCMYTVTVYYDLVIQLPNCGSFFIFYHS